MIILLKTCAGFYSKSPHNFIGKNGSIFMNDEFKNLTSCFLTTVLVTQWAPDNMEMMKYVRLITVR